MYSLCGSRVPLNILHFKNFATTINFYTHPINVPGIFSCHMHISDLCHFLGQANSKTSSFLKLGSQTTTCTITTASRDKARLEFEKASIEFQKVSIGSGKENSGPANTKHLYNICTTSAQRLWRWSSIVWILYKCFVFAGGSDLKDSFWRCIHTYLALWGTRLSGCRTNLLLIQQTYTHLLVQAHALSRMTSARWHACITNWKHTQIHHQG